jgi:hypothetical protein
VKLLAGFFGESAALPADDASAAEFAAPHARQSRYLQAPVFHRYHTEHEMLRYIKRLESKDLSLVHSMISLGSCTMKLNASSEMFPVSWPEFSQLHPFAPAEQTRGYQKMFRQLEAWLDRDHRLRRRFAPAQRRLSGRIRRTARDPRLPPVARRGPPQHLPHPNQRARHQPRQRRDVRL